MMKPRALTKPSSELVGYGNVLGELVALIESVRRDGNDEEGCTMSRLQTYLGSHVPE